MAAAYHRAMATIPTLETERLVLRPFREDDFEAHAAMAADPLGVRYLRDGTTLDRLDAWRTFAIVFGHWELRGYGLWALARRGDDRMIGRVGFINPEGWPGFEIGWTLARSEWGNGYATEAARRALAYAFDVMGREKVISVIHPENAASIRVAERIGERFERIELVKGEERLIYSIARGDRRG
jgi:RimJ/RimL family protein N-acetyltransferase